MGWRVGLLAGETQQPKEGAGLFLKAVDLLEGGGEGAGDGAPGEQALNRGVFGRGGAQCPGEPEEFGGIEANQAVEEEWVIGPAFLEEEVQFLRGAGGEGHGGEFP
jgi:hypothetical protein